MGNRHGARLCAMGTMFGRVGLYTHKRQRMTLLVGMNPSYAEIYTHKRDDMQMFVGIKFGIAEICAHANANWVADHWPATQFSH